MKILILEGVATSGKSTLAKAIPAKLQGSRVEIFDELKTHEPIMEQRSELHLDFFKKLLGEITSINADLVILERFHFTQAIRANADINKYAEIEELLHSQGALMVLLKIDEDSLSQRITDAIAHREKEWGEYVQTRGKNEQEIAQYYIDQQRSYLELLNQSKLSRKVVNVTTRDYDSAAQEIIGSLSH